MPMPTPNKGESQDDFMKRFMSNNIMKKDFPQQKQRLAVGFAQWKKTHSSNINLTYNVPILIESELEESAGKDFIIKGIAINSTTTDNNHQFLPEELQNAAPTLLGRPLLKDHIATTDNIVGKVIDSRYNPLTKSVEFKARLNDTENAKNIKKLIQNGDLDTVSVGANVSELEEGEDEKGENTFIPRGIQFKELSVVAVPADDNARFSMQSFQIALNEALKVKETMVDFPKCDEEVDFARLAVSSELQAISLYEDMLQKISDQRFKDALTNAISDEKEHMANFTECIEYLDPEQAEEMDESEEENEEEGEVGESLNEDVVTAMEAKRKSLGMSPSEFYAIPRDPPSSSKLPIFDAVHTRNAMARLNQIKGASSEEKATAKNKILKAAKKFGIETTNFESYSQKNDNIVKLNVEGGKKLMEEKEIETSTPSRITELESKVNSQTSILAEVLSSVKSLLEKEEKTQKEKEEEKMKEKKAKEKEENKDGEDEEEGDGKAKEAGDGMGPGDMTGAPNQTPNNKGKPNKNPNGSPKVAQAQTAQKAVGFVNFDESEDEVLNEKNYNIVQEYNSFAYKPLKYR